VPSAVAAIVLSSVRSTRCVLSPLLEWDVDTAIVDVEIHDQTLLNVSIVLENVKMPFVFANRPNRTTAVNSVTDDSAALCKQPTRYSVHPERRPLSLTVA